VIWHRTNRYYRRAATELVRLVEEFSDPNIGRALGQNGELLVLEGFSRRQFVTHGRNTSRYRGRGWQTTEHDLDFIFERDGLVYGVEVKNTLAYMEYKELRTKIDLCDYLGIMPVFVARMLPKSWVNEVRLAGGFSLILEFQLYPLTHQDLARRLRTKLSLPVGTPKALEDGTIDRFRRWHRGNLGGNSPR
jgi:hypothetical protein